MCFGNRPTHQQKYTKQQDHCRLNTPFFNLRLVAPTAVDAGNRTQQHGKLNLKKIVCDRFIPSGGFVSKQFFFFKNPEF